MVISRGAMQAVVYNGFSATASPRICHLIWSHPGLNPTLGGEKPGSNRPFYGTATLCTVRCTYTGWTGRWVPGGCGSQISRQSAHEAGKVVSHMHCPPSTPYKHSWYSFLLRAESTPGPQCRRKDYVNEKFQRHDRVSNPRLSGL
jgi:hypothetical protein